MNYQIFPGLKTKQDSKIRASELHMGDEFRMFNVSYMVLSVNETGIQYKLKCHSNDVKAGYQLGRRSQKLVIKKAQQ